MTILFGVLINYSCTFIRRVLTRPFVLVVPRARLLDTLHFESKLYLVFEFLDNDLKRYQELMNASHTPLSLELIKVRKVSLHGPVSF